MPSGPPAAKTTVTPALTDSLALACGQPGSSSNADGVSGTWLAQPGGIAGYRAREKWADVTLPHEAVARTQRVTGWVVLSEKRGVTLDRACFAVELASLISEDQVPGQNMPDRDKNVRGFLNTETHPFAVFRATSATLLSARPTGSRAHVNVKGQLEIDGISQPANLSIDVDLVNEQLNLAGNALVVATDYGVELPTVADFVAVDPHITVEFSVSMARITTPTHAAAAE